MKKQAENQRSFRGSTSCSRSRLHPWREVRARAQSRSRGCCLFGNNGRSSVCVRLAESRAIQWKATHVQITLAFRCLNSSVSSDMRDFPRTSQPLESAQKKKKEKPTFIVSEDGWQTIFLRQTEARAPRRWPGSPAMRLLVVLLAVAGVCLCTARPAEQQNPETGVRVCGREVSLWLALLPSARFCTPSTAPKPVSQWAPRGRRALAGRVIRCLGETAIANGFSVEPLFCPAKRTLEGWR
jgi:hypothetical protein